MDKKAPRNPYVILLILLPVFAIASLTVATYLWYRALKPELFEVREQIWFRTSPESFSRELEPNLHVVLNREGIGAELVTVSQADSTLPGISRIYRVRVPQKASLRLFNTRITRMTADMGGEVFQGIENETGTTLTLKVGAGREPTDIIILRKSSRVTARSGKMAIIIDDFGYRTPDIAERLCNLRQTVTLSILPFQPYTRQIVDLARSSGTPYILHMPMEPGTNQSDPGPGAITTADPESNILEKLARAFSSVSGAPGCNNHMGSKATEDVRVMEVVVTYLRENGYFFLDSQTSRQSLGYPLSQKAGVKSAILTSYLDVEDDPAFIENRIEELAERAFDEELVITIGHCRPNTTDVLERKLPELEERGITFVRVADVVH